MARCTSPLGSRFERLSCDCKTRLRTGRSELYFAADLNNNTMPDDDAVAIPCQDGGQRTLERGLILYSGLYGPGHSGMMLATYRNAQENFRPDRLIAIEVENKFGEDQCP